MNENSMEILCLVLEKKTAKCAMYIKVECFERQLVK